MNPLTDVASWYSDGDVLLTEIRRGRRDPVAAPDIRGYDSFEMVGRGGQGVVFSAVQRGTGRRVAVKVLLDGAFASPQARRRFEREIELVAALEHPGIVRVFDSGTTDDGRLYCVMEFISGQPLDAWMRANPGSAARDQRDTRHARAWRRTRLEMAAAIADAVQSAHQRGIIHRDLKPGNVLVDAEGRPHVLDFGLGKAFVEGTTAVSVQRAVSITGQFVGSVPWASPEQARGQSDVDVRSDVYALGVMTYQLLAGTLPYDVTGSLAESLENIAHAAPAPLRSHDSALEHDVETVVLKALSKEPARRYQSAGDFAADLRRAAGGEPIDARRDSTWYLLRVAARRHRTMVAAAGLVLVVLTAGVAATSWQWHLTDLQRQRADRRFDDVRGLARTFMFDMHDAIVDLPGSRAAREKLVKTSLEYLQSLAAESGGNDALSLEIADGHQRIGDILGNPYLPNLGDTNAALREYEHGLALVDPMVERVRRGEALPEAQRAQALKLAVSLDNHMGEVITVQGDRTKAIEWHKKALDVLALDEAGTTAGAAPTTERARRGIRASTNLKIADALSWGSDREAALTSFQAAAAEFEALAKDPQATDRDKFNVQVARNKVGFMLGLMERYEEALEQQRAALEISQALLAVQPTNAGRKRSVQINHNQAGAMLVNLKRTQEAMQHFDAAFAIAREVVAADPKNRQAQSDLAYTHNKIGEAMWQEQPAVAKQHFEDALQIRRTLQAQDPSNAEETRGVVVACCKVAYMHTLAAKDEKAAADERKRQALAGRALYAEGLSVIDAMRKSGTLGGVDDALPAELETGLKECDAILGGLGDAAGANSG